MDEANSMVLKGFDVVNIAVFRKMPDSRCVLDFRSDKRSLNKFTKVNRHLSIVTRKTAETTTRGSKVCVNMVIP